MKWFFVILTISCITLCARFQIQTGEYNQTSDTRFAVKIVLFFQTHFPIDIDICSLPRDTGFCRAYFPRFYYNSKIKSCKKFIYGGCGGNRNSFDTEEECSTTCNGQILKNTTVSSK